MKYFYDLHIHSGLSPCSNDDMTPNNIIGMAKIKGLNIIAISDHNSIKNIQVTEKIAREYEILIIPSMELQSNEDIHLLCLFRDYLSIEAFYNSLEFPHIINQPNIWGNQLIYDENDEITGTEERLLITSCNLGLYEIIKIVKDYNGLVIPAHIDRESNGILNILGAIDEDMGFKTLEVSPLASNELKNQYKDNYILITNSDAHSLGAISEANNFIEIENLDINTVLDYFSKRG